MLYTKVKCKQLRDCTRWHSSMLPETVPQAMSDSRFLAGIIQKLKAYYRSCPDVVNHWLCSATDHCAASYGDKGWGCGYRNLQMILSCLATSPTYEPVIFNGTYAHNHAITHATIYTHFKFFIDQCLIHLNIFQVGFCNSMCSFYFVQNTGIGISFFVLLPSVK